MKSPSPALIVSLIALSVALGGTGYAVTQLPKNSVGAAQIKKNAVTGAKVKAGSLEASDFAPGTLAAGPRGPAGPAGPAGPTGSQGAVGPTEAIVVPATSFTADPAASPDQPGWRTASFTTTKAGRLVLSFRTRTFMTCDNGSGYGALYLDGVPVPNSRFILPTSHEWRTTSGVTAANIPAGAHLVEFSADCPTGDWTGLAAADPVFSVLVVGS